MSRRSARYVAAAVSVALGACASWSEEARPPDPGVSDAAEVFRAVALDLLTRADGVILFIDPRPMDIGVRLHPRETDYHGGTDAVIAERLAVLADLGIDDAAALPVIPDCHPLMSAPPGQRVVHGCPPDHTIVALLDTVRAGTEAGTWVLRRLPIAYRPGYGRVGNVSDMVVGRRDGIIIIRLSGSGAS